MIGQQVALIHDPDRGFARASLHAWPEACGRLTEHGHLPTGRASPTPSWRKRHDGAILRDKGRNETEATLDGAELDQSTAGREDQLGVDRYPGHVSRRYGQSIVPIE